MQNQPAPNAPPPTIPPPGLQKKKRHGCLTTWLILIIIANVVVTILSVSLYSSDSEHYARLLMSAQIIFGVWAVICAIALFMWKKWGFYGFFAGAVASMIIDLISGNYVYALTPFFSVAILYGILNIGKDNKGWPQLE